MRAWWLLGLTLLVMASTQSVQAYRIVFKDVADAKRVYKTEMTMKGSTEGGGIQMPMEGSIAFITTERVLAVEGGKALIETVISDGKLEMSMSGPDGSAEPMTQDLPETTMAFKRSPLGAISDFEMENSLIAGMGLDNQLGTLQNPGQHLDLPDKDVKIGDKWTNKATIDLAGGKAKIEMTYVLKGIKKFANKQYLQIDCDFTVTLPTVVVLDTPEMNMKMALKMKGHSVTFFDEKAGEIYAAALSVDNDITMTSNDPSMGTVKTTVTLKGTMKQATE